MVFRFVVLLGLLGVCSGAWADFRVLLMQEPDLTQPPVGAVIEGQQTRWASAPVFLQRGVPAAVVQTLFNSQSRVPLIKALPQLLPTGWQAKIHPSYRNFVVSWTAGTPWVEVIRGIAHAIGADAMVDWSQRQVVFDPGVRDVLVLQQGSLKAALGRWANDNGWRLHWNVRRYPDLTVPFSEAMPFGMDLREAVANVVQSYRARKQINLKADFFQSNLLLELRCDAGGC